MNHEAVYRTTPATPGLLITVTLIYFIECCGPFNALLKLMPTIFNDTCHVTHDTWHVTHGEDSLKISAL